MSFLSQSEDRPQETPEERKEQRRAAQQEHWDELLSEVKDPEDAGKPWWKRLLIFWAWAGGFAGSAAVVVVIVVLIAELFSKERVFTARVVSDWMFWASATLMLFGLVSPSSSDLQQATNKKDKKKKEKKNQDPQDRSLRTMRRRLRRAYDPWRWRLWGSALLAFSLSALIGLLA